MFLQGWLTTSISRENLNFSLTLLVEVAEACPADIAAQSDGDNKVVLVVRCFLTAIMCLIMYFANWFLKND